jgi:hypothetical protein
MVKATKNEAITEVRIIQPESYTLELTPAEMDILVSILGVFEAKDDVFKLYSTMYNACDNPSGGSVQDGSGKTVPLLKYVAR